MINTILGYYFSLVQEKEIPLKADIHVKEHYPFSITDMTVLLGNAMENALEACGREIKQYKAALLIQIENRCPESGYPVMEEGKTPSTKRGRNHGYGISSMGAIAEKYQGSLEFWKKGSVFTLRIVLNIPEEPELQADRKKDGYGGE